MYDTISSFSIVDAIFPAASILFITRACEYAKILKTNNESYHNKQLLLGAAVVSTMGKMWKEMLFNDSEGEAAKFIDFSIDTIIILPPIVSIWQPRDNSLSHGVYLATVLAAVPSYISTITTDLAKYLVSKKENDGDNESNESYRSSYTYTTTKGIIPAFTRGVLFFNLKQATNNEVISALISGSIRGLMLDESKEYTALGANIAISGLNAAANKLPYLKFNTILDRFYPDSSAMVAIEFAEYFLRSIQIDKMLHDTLYNSQNSTTTALNNESDSSNIHNEL
jgi:hypothetical protein